jgi:metal transporter CNNM
MAPAPKARVPKGQIVTDTEIDTATTDQLIDISEEPNGDALQRTRLASVVSNRSNSPATRLGTSPRTTLMMRRNSNTPEGSVGAVPVRANVNEMREHLKHLGPSNLASRPKQTRYNTVKIKPGTGLLSTDGNLTRHDSIVEEPYRDDPAPRGGEGEGLLKSAGKDASDGVQAVQQGYGSFDARRSSISKSSSKSITSPLLEVDCRAEERPKSGGSKHESTPASPLRPSSRPTSRPTSRREDSNETHNSSDTLGSLPSKELSPPRLGSGIARSGSITENVIDTNGVRKVVLETTSSSDDVDLANKENALPGGMTDSTTSLPNGAQNEDGPSADGGQPKGEEVKKKAKRRRKRKNGGRS